MSQENGKFTIALGNLGRAVTVERDGIFIGRLERCEIRLDHPAVSRIHAGVNFVDKRYQVVNLSSSNVLTLNGRLLGPQKSDILANGDTIQIGPFTIDVAITRDAIRLGAQGHSVVQKVPVTTENKVGKQKADEPDGVLKVFWDKRTREKEDWGSRLRPTEPPKPGKAMFNWRPTKDLRRPWRFGLFVWAFIILGAAGTYAFLKYPQAYSPRPIANPHAQNIEGSTIAVRANANSCTTCHAPNEPLENACIKCHQADSFHATNTKAHEQAGVTCTVCHKEHMGSEFDMNATAIASCAECHNDNNKKTYNGKTVQTAHGGSYGYPIENGIWKWKGISREVAAAIPEINSSATGDRDEQTRLSRYFHTIHVGRLKVPDSVKGDKRGLVSCSTCHKSSDPIDRETPRTTCAACHTGTGSAVVKDERFAGSASNCISCHVQHPFSSDRWNEFLSDGAQQRRRDAVGARIKELKPQ